VRAHRTHTPTTTTPPHVAPQVLQCIVSIHGKVQGIDADESGPTGLKSWCPMAAGAGVGGGSSLYVAQEAYDLKLADLCMHLLMCMPCMLVYVLGDGYVGWV
jgi:hypothetical protein